MYATPDMTSGTVDGWVIWITDGQSGWSFVIKDLATSFTSDFVARYKPIICTGHSQIIIVKRAIWTFHIFLFNGMNKC